MGRSRSSLTRRIRNDAYDWQKHGYDDAADDDRQSDDHDWFQERSHCADRVVHLFFIVVGYLQQHIWQRAGLLAYIHHAGDHDRKYARSFEGGGDGVAFLYPVMDGRDYVTYGDVAGGFF